MKKTLKKSENVRRKSPQPKKSHMWIWPREVCLFPETKNAKSTTHKNPGHILPSNNATNGRVLSIRRLFSNNILIQYLRPPDLNFNSTKTALQEICWFHLWVIYNHVLYIIHENFKLCTPFLKFTLTYLKIIVFLQNEISQIGTFSPVKLCYESSLPPSGFHWDNDRRIGGGIWSWGLSCEPTQPFRAEET